ncbi:hypothetical protein [Tuberibacillus calidus]|jgi:hypothetical protein|uniref:hypothetical protein n=1 Tax=Tuberibacillus calidus TaxID=340097 RepID=UPI00040F8C1C|nr:hypothetical protein [Tuberibacillus calidus]
MTPEQVLGYREVKINDKIYKIAFNVRAMLKLKQKFGTIQDIFNEFAKQDMDSLVFIIKTGLEKYHKDISPEELQEQIEDLDFGDFLILVKQASEFLLTQTLKSLSEEERDALPPEMQAFLNEAKKK